MFYRYKKNYVYVFVCFVYGKSQYISVGYVINVFFIYNKNIGCVKVINLYFWNFFSDIFFDIEFISISVYNYSKRFIDKEIGKLIGKLFYFNKKYLFVDIYILFQFY